MNNHDDLFLLQRERERERERERDAQTRRSCRFNILKE